MGFWGGRISWVNGYGKKWCRSLFWKVRAHVKKAMKSGSERRLRFQYDAWSYSLNFDDGQRTAEFCRFKTGDDASEMGSWVPVARPSIASVCIL
ncbi:hypothetical protein AMTRI_Chr02g261860 [Amborella trichopoda]|uniref:Uncharacterized protein n=1 Tax=Amborella trichopoda TaxID=13333 RepID=W1P6V6_AMBTC|nr:hypothetical protein AMTR_s00003p00259370 [Amborella trichopoda]